MRCTLALVTLLLAPQARAYCEFDGSPATFTRCVQEVASDAFDQAMANLESLGILREQVDHQETRLGALESAAPMEPQLRWVVVEHECDYDTYFLGLGAARDYWFRVDEMDGVEGSPAVVSCIIDEGGRDDDFDYVQWNYDIGQEQCVLLNDDEAEGWSVKFRCIETGFPDRRVRMTLGYPI